MKLLIQMLENRQRDVIDHKQPQSNVQRIDILDFHAGTIGVARRDSCWERDNAFIRFNTDLEIFQSEYRKKKEHAPPHPGRWTVKLSFDNAILLHRIRSSLKR